MSMLMRRIGGSRYLPSLIRRSSTTTKSSVDPDEINRFRQLSSAWWNETGEYAPLHSFNQLRIPFIREQLLQTSHSTRNAVKPLTGLHLVDIGCGGGILSEPLARLGASVLGIDAVKENISTARYHADPSLQSNLKYEHVTLEELCENFQHVGKYDGVIASEVLEHVNDVDGFIMNIQKLLKPKGLCFITTLNQTLTSYVFGIFLAEYVFRIVPPGTHTWNKFIRPSDLIVLLEKHQFSVLLNNGMVYNPITNRWSWSTNQSINYAICAEKH